MPIKKNCILLSDKKTLFLLDLSRKSIRVVFASTGYVPPLTLNLIADSDKLYYGEYSRHGSKVPPSVYAITRKLEITRIFTFPEKTIDHIHCVHYWKDQDALIVLTGDFPETIGIWIYTLCTRKLTPAYINGQASRFCWILPGHGIFYGATDSQLENNYLKLIKFDTKNMIVSHAKNIAALRGSSIYACESSKEIFFSTVVEPGMPTGRLLKDLFTIERGPGILDDCARIYAYSKCGSYPLEEVICAKKDPIPPRIGQFGTFSFPSGRNPTNHLFAYGIAVEDFGDCLIRIAR